MRSDNVQDNSNGMDPYAYVGDNPETRNDPSGHCWPLCTMIIGAIVGAAVSVAVTVVSNAVQGKPTSLGQIAQSAVVGAVSGAVAGLAGPEAGPVAKMAVGALSSAAGQLASNAMSGKPLMDGVGQAALIGGVTGGAGGSEGAEMENVAADAEGALSDGENALSDAGESCGLSFIPTTPVATNHGEQAIGTLEVGEQVWAYNPTTKKMELEPIQHIWLNHDNDLVDLTLTATIKGSDGKTTQKDEVIHTNERHPFLTKEKGFIPVSQLQPGMHVRQADGSYGTVAKLVVVPGAMWMYNLTVAQDHTYVVGLEQWIVHNCSGGFKNGVSADEIRDINTSLGGSTELNGSAESVLATADRYTGFWKKAAVIVRGIAGGHLFDDANKRTAFGVVQTLMERNNIMTGALEDDMRYTIWQVAAGRLRSIEYIASGLQGF